VGPFDISYRVVSDFGLMAMGTTSPPIPSCAPCGPIGTSVRAKVPKADSLLVQIALALHDLVS
jgi:hypothetical protein